MPDQASPRLWCLFGNRHGTKDTPADGDSSVLPSIFTIPYSFPCLPGGWPDSDDDKSGLTPRDSPAIYCMCRLGATGPDVSQPEPHIVPTLIPGT